MDTPDPGDLRDEYAPELIAGGVRGKYSAKPLRFRLLRWLQFRLRTMLAVVLLICAALAWWVWYTRHEPPSALLPPGPGPWFLASERGARIQAGLREPTQMEFNETPLHDVLDYIGVLHQIKVRVDEQALEEAKFDSLSVRFTRVLKDRVLEDALASLLNSKGLVWVIEDDTLVVTTPAAAVRYSVSYVYSLADLPQKDATPGTLRRLIRQALEGDGTAVKSTAKNDNRPMLDERLRVVGGALIFRGTYEEQSQVAGVLKELREAAEPK